MMSFDWKSLTTDELELQFNPRAVPANRGDFDRIFAELSAAARSSLRHEAGIRYGTADQMLMDIFPADDPAAPTMIFIHGGYWRARTKDEFGFV
ncbi:MAG: alpha/beta hydrolase, partial [Rhodospirillales bacterium]